MKKIIIVNSRAGFVVVSNLIEYFLKKKQPEITHYNYSSGSKKKSYKRTKRS